VRTHLAPGVAGWAAPVGGRRLEMAAWLVAWDRFTLAAVAVDMMSFADAQRHKNNVVEVSRVVVAVTACGRSVWCVAGGGGWRG